MEAGEQRARYAGYLADNSCVGAYVGQIVPRNTCWQPWLHKLDLRLRRVVETVGNQRTELEVDFFNVENGLNSDWSRYHTVSGFDRNIYLVRRYDWSNNRILYSVPENISFGEPSRFSGLRLQCGGPLPLLSRHDALRQSLAGPRIRASGGLASWMNPGSGALDE